MRMRKWHARRQPSTSVERFVFVLVLFLTQRATLAIIPRPKEVAMKPIQPAAESAAPRMVFRQVRIASIKQSPRGARRPAAEREDSDADAAPSLARPGRGATTNPAIRFETQASVPCDDGWGSLEACFGELPPLETVLIRDNSRTAIARNTSPDIGFDRSINPYRPSDARLSRLFAGSRFRDQAAVQAGGRQPAGARIEAAVL
jgi:hypothetical protein